MSGNKKKEGNLDGEDKRIGMIAKPRFIRDSSFVESLTSNVSSTVNGILSYLPTSVSKNIPGVPEESFRPKVLWASFQRAHIKRAEDKYPMPPQGNLFLLLGYADGFQIWDCTNSEEIHEVLSIKEGATRCVKILEYPREEEDQLLNENNEKQEGSERFQFTRPHLAAVCHSKADTSQKIPWSHVKIFSLKSQEAVHILRFKSEVYNVYSNARILVVCLHDQLFTFDTKTYRSTFSISNCESNPLTGSSVVALGPRWLAYASSQLPVKNHKKGKQDDENGYLSHKVVGAAKDVAVDFASKAYQWGNKAFSTYFSGTEGGSTYSKSPPKKTPTEAPKTETSSETHGSLIIRDVVTKSSVAHFQAHTNPISAMAFNPSGFLLVTASSQGHDFNVYQIIPNVHGDPSSSTFSHLYILKRGIFTNAIIEDISFNNNSQWVNVTSARGTTHIFPINPYGGPVTVETHYGESYEGKSAIIKNGNEEPILIHPLARIYQPSPLGQGEEDKDKNPSPTNIQSIIHKTPIASYFVNRIEQYSSDDITSRSLDVGLYIINPLGVLSLFILSPQVQITTNKTGEETRDLKLQVEHLIEWNVLRNENFQPVTLPFEKSQSPKRKSSKHSNTRWLSQVEISTHVIPNRPIWMGPQFNFKTYQTTQNGDSHDVAEAIIPSNNSEDENLTDDELPSRSLPIRLKRPIPYINNSNSESNVTRNSNRELEDDLSDAIGTALNDDIRDDLKFEDEALVLGGYESPINSFKDEWEWQGQHFEAGDEDSFEALDRMNIRSPDGDNEVESPLDSVLLEEEQEEREDDEEEEE